MKKPRLVRGFFLGDEISDRIGCIASKPTSI